MNENDLIRKITNSFETLGVPYFITGGIASIAYGEPRFTNDIDVVADISEPLVPNFLAQYPSPEYYLSSAAVYEAINRRSQFNILHPSSGLKVDVMLPARTDYDRLRMSRVSRMQLDSGTAGWFASPEDVILKKLMYFQLGGSEKHLRDIAGMLLIMDERIDHVFISTWANKLAVAAEWQLVLARVNERKSRGM